MTKDTIHDENVMEKFKEWQENHYNPLTSELRRFSVLENGIVVEFSQDTRKELFGVTIVKHAPDFEHSEFKAVNYNLDRPFRDLSHAKAYYDAIRIFVSENDMETIENAEKEDLTVRYDV